MSNATYALTVSGTHYNQFEENILHFIGDTADGSATLDEGNDLIASFRNTVEGEFLSCLPPTYILDRYVARCVLPEGPGNNAHLQIINEHKIGTSGTGAASENLCPVINLIPPMGIKSGGRVYMPCIAKEDINNNQFQGGYTGAINDLFTDMIAGISASSITWKLAIFSTKNGTSSRALAFSLSAAIGFQGKRRKPM